MAKFLFVLGALLCLQLVSCRVVRDTQAQAPDFSEWAKQAETALGELNQKFLEVVGVKSNDELATLVQTQGKQYGEKLQGLVQQLATEASKADGVVQSIAARLGTAVEELKSQTETNPDVQKLQDEFQKRLQTIYKETEQYGAKIKEHGQSASANVDKVLKEILENTVTTAKKVAQDVQTVIQEKKA